MASGAPAPQTVGSSAGSDPIAEMQKKMAKQMAQQAASQTRSGMNEVRLYITENPASIKVMCFLVGLVLIVFSILGCFNLFDAALEPKEYLANVYNVFFVYVGSMTLLVLPDSWFWAMIYIVLGSALCF